MFWWVIVAVVVVAAGWWWIRRSRVDDRHVVDHSAIRRTTRDSQSKGFGAGGGM